jgi:hypothetical protein
MLLDVGILPAGSFVGDTSWHADMNHVGLTDVKHDVDAGTEIVIVVGSSD